MQTKKLTFSALLVAIGTIASNLVYIPVGAAKCFPVQHTINVLSAVMLGPWYGLANAFLISLLRNMLGTGSILAFPGSMVGAFIAGVMYLKSGRKLFAAAGEIFGTGILGGLLAFPIAKFVMGNDAAAFYFVVPFLISTVGGSMIGYAILGVMERSQILKKTGI
ncbi:MAG TPA: energy coupling factor transporter S component ThiW [Bacillota bacterium]|jgi:energy coupling factor transporter S component ThiW|nr:energy coupling factor transporter S component ThiW [Bacillota bacterium]HRS20166.1 energy coupling factor transporter S component ThiW [Clostridia bacterium]HRU40343.1 energy coupling factor transporter S component ThiW [Candidatus Diapherotrites archaeon]HOS69163.1 energy coupling factor transporter S component ThiW [Bacillota bacterium]HQE65782.1 energy coupling factor transporter S component ThiW [Bacillota bacterium]